jgi:hypothetical protein
MAKTQYRSQASADIRELLAQLNKAKILPYGYPGILAEKAGCTLSSAQQTVSGRSAKLGIVEIVVKEAEKILGIKATKPKRLDFSDWSIERMTREKVLPNRYSELAAELTELSPHTVQIVKSGYGTSKTVEEALRQLASYNQELELRHRLEKIIEACNEKSPAK